MIYLFLNNGGLGNQMFQYAMARRLQLEYDMDIVCDLTSFNYKGTSATNRQYCLDVSSCRSNGISEGYCSESIFQSGEDVDFEKLF